MNLKELRTAQESATKARSLLEARLELLEKQKTDLELELQKFGITPETVNEGIENLQSLISNLTAQCQDITKQLQSKLK